jgi:endonuclease/exonuclease/phosphatase family metal-dependent hydrolase
MRVLTWNVAGRITRLGEQAEAVAAIDADVVALQEVTPRGWPLWQAALSGYDAIWSLEDCAFEGHKPLGVVLAARGGVERLPRPEGPWPERLVCGRVGGVAFACAHSPISPAPELAKVRWHETLSAALSGWAPPAVLLGDLNTPRRESPDGMLLTFAHNSDGSLRASRGERWDAAERALIRTLGWTDAWRAVHGAEAKAVSWAWPNGGGYRLDHVLVTPDIEVRAAEYLHDVRTAKLSDHSALVAELACPA